MPNIYIGAVDIVPRNIRHFKYVNVWQPIVIVTVNVNK